MPVPALPDMLAFLDRSTIIDERPSIELGQSVATAQGLLPDEWGAASIGQVHGAVLHDGTPVVVTIRRPGLRETFERDLRAMALAAAAGHDFLGRYPEELSQIMADIQ